MASLAATVTTTTEVRLEPSVRRKLLQALRVYAQLKEQRDAIEAAMKKQNGIIADIREEIGETSVKLEGFVVTLVAGIRQKFNPKKYVAEGGDLAVYNASFDDVPVKSYTKVTLPGAKTEDEE